MRSLGMDEGIRNFFFWDPHPTDRKDSLPAGFRDGSLLT